jgi:hypothetical protein
MSGKDGKGELIQKREKSKDRGLARIGNLSSLEGNGVVMICIKIDAAKSVLYLLDS